MSWIVKGNVPWKYCFKSEQLFEASLKKKKEKNVDFQSQECIIRLVLRSVFPSILVSVPYWNFIMMPTNYVPYVHGSCAPITPLTLKNNFKTRSAAGFKCTFGLSEGKLFNIYIFFSLKDKEKVKSTCALTKNRSGCICPCLTVRLSTDPLIMEFSEPAWRTLEALEYMDLSGLTITIKIPYSCSHLYIAKDVLTLPVHWALARFQRSQPVQIITGKNPYKTKTARLIIERWIHFLLF